MKRNGIFLLTILLMVGIFGQASASLVFRYDISGTGVVEGTVKQIQSGQPFFVDVYGTNTDPRTGFGMTFTFSGTGTVTNVTWTDTSTWVDPAFKALQTIFATTYAESWDGDLTDEIIAGEPGDLFNFTGATLNNCFATDGVEHLLLHCGATITLDQAGTFCIDTGVAADPTYNWLFEDPQPTFDGGNSKVCWEVLGQSDVKDRSDLPLPKVYALNQNYPNPFNPTTTIDFALPTASHVKLVVYNLLGQKIKTLVDEQLTAGYKSVTWDGMTDSGSAAASGIYFYKIEANNYANTKKLMLLK
ncbi:hypothetical protein TRIP_C90468 [Candidatus Zixiibacteriota bacterium]|nr:hypothetical protein TRIP_C90468 [candidate division Zixibacteria bacterium]